ncbi:hypothetical protein [Janibacter melonis]|uniref:hypothetical protein n=1 Tax=Janibacter melonis TaxID=262209 RepID=UPI00177ED9D6|nr:hypothetical protein [Janibacter melonis]
MTWTRTVLAVALALPLLIACGSSRPCPEPVSVDGSSEVYAAQDAEGVGGQGTGVGSDPGRGGSATTSSSGVLTTEVLE